MSQAGSSVGGVRQPGAEDVEKGSVSQGLAGGMAIAKVTTYLC